jgi:DNA topoisomerase-1
MGVKQFKPYKKFATKKGTKPEPEYIRTELQKWLIIVESPSKCTKIEHLLGSQYKCIASYGHLRKIDGMRSINVKKDFEIKFSNIETKIERIAKMQKIIQQFDSNHILLGSDDDREGEAIAWHICDIFKLDIKTTPRIIFHEITESALKTAVNNPTHVNMNIVRAQWARQVLDILIGYKISPLLWRYMHNNKTNSLSAGRCQTPALRLVYENEMERIAGIGAQQKYKILGKLSTSSSVLSNLDFVLNREFDSKEETLQFLKKSIKFEYSLSIGSPKPSVTSPPQPFNTSHLLQTCNNILHISPTETMSICQDLYQSGFITYMRTENKKYSNAFLDSTKKYITDSYGEKYLGEIHKLENKDSSNPHEAIRVTDIHRKELGETSKKASLYRLIWKNTVQSCMKESTSTLTDACVTAPDDNTYKHTIETPVFLGWKTCGSQKDTLEKEQSKESGIIFFLKTILASETKIQFQKIDAMCVFHNKHSHYTESSLIKKLEDYGIGRPSTFAMFIETIEERGYVKKRDLEGVKTQCKEYTLKDGKIFETQKEILVGNEKNKLVVQPIGIAVCEFLMKYFGDIFSYSYTKQIEEKLDEVASTSFDGIWHTVCEECSTNIKTAVKPLTGILTKKYPLDEVGAVVVFSANGPIICYEKPSTDAADAAADATTDEEPKKQPNIKSIRKDIQIDIERLKSGGYKVSDLEEVESQTRLLGKWEDVDIYIKHGRFGYYFEWGSQKKGFILEPSLSATDVTIEDVPRLIDTNTLNNKNVLRVINSNTSIRRGKFGAYVYYKTAQMPTPKFFSMKGFKRGFSTCEIKTLTDWLKETHNVE